MKTIRSITLASPPRRQKQFWRRQQLFSAWRDTVEFLISSLTCEQGAKAFAKWQINVASLYGEVFVRPRMREHCAALAKALNVAANPGALVFALHTTYGFLARAVVIQHLLPPCKHARLAVAEFIRALADSNFYQREFGVCNFLPELWDEEIVDLVEHHDGDSFAKLLEFSCDASPSLAVADWQNVLTNLYQTIIPSAIRHDLGEFFTPDWLADKTITMAGFNGEIDKTVFDPGCGSGSFLLTAAVKKMGNRAPTHDILTSVLGCDLNPLSVLSARLNFLLLLSKQLALPLPEVDLPILHYDSVFQTPLGRTTADTFRKYLFDGCDYLVGNPPWISWNCLPPAYRMKLETELLPQYVLFDFHGQAARLGHSNDDYLSTFTLITIDRYLKKHGICSFVIKQPLLTNVAGKTFRRFEIRHRNGMTPLRVIKAADLRRLNPFGIANETAILALEKGAPTTYPVDYDIWSKPNGHIEFKAERAQPSALSDLSSPWVILSNEWMATRFMEGVNPYEIRHGVKHDAAEVLIVRSLEKRNERLVIARIAASDQIYEIEPDWVRPFLQPRHLKRWGMDGCLYFVMPQHKAGEDNENELALHFPLTYAFLEHFAPQFAARRSKVFLNKPFYGLFGLGGYTHARYKVCWIGLGFQPRFAVAEEMDDPFLGGKPVVPDGTLYFMPFASRDQAHFVCALLNSELVCKFLSARSGKSKRGLSKKVVEQLALPEFNREDERHVYLAQVSRQLHEAFRRKIFEDAFPTGFDEVVKEVFQNSKSFTE